MAHERVRDPKGGGFRVVGVRSKVSFPAHRLAVGLWPVCCGLIAENGALARTVPPLRLTTPARPAILTAVPVAVLAPQRGRGAAWWRRVGTPCGYLTATMPDMPMPTLRASLTVAAPGRCAAMVVLTMPGRWQYAVRVTTAAGTRTLHRAVQARN